MRRLWIAALLAPSLAHAEVSVGGSVGAGAQGAATYSAVELRLDAQWTRGHLGLGMRGVWDDAAFRGSEWASPWSTLTIVRDAMLHATWAGTDLALAAGALAPANVGRVVDGYRVSLDDRWRTGVRAAARSQDVEAGAEVDDVLDPRLIAAGVSWLMAPPWGMHAHVAIDPGVATAVEVGGIRRFEGDAARLDVGVSIIAEPAPTGIVFAAATFDRADARWALRGDARVGSAGLFGPLYRVEGSDDSIGAGAGIAASVAGDRGWLELGARRRPSLGGMYVAGAGAPMGRWFQAAAWAAIARDAAAGAGELRVVWSRRLFSALHVARMYRFDAMEPAPVWSVTAWFGAATQ